MLDFDTMMKLQKEGLQQIGTLQGETKGDLQLLCSLNTEALLKMGAQNKAPFDEVVVNAIKTGVALGLRVEIVNGQLCGRQP